jgi:hypothetical protein
MKLWKMIFAILFVSVSVAGLVSAREKGAPEVRSTHAHGL